MYSSPYLSVHYRADLHVLTVRWLAEPPATVAKAEYQALLAEACAHQSARWLMDSRRRPEPDVELAEWVVNAWFGQAVAALRPARLRMAYLMPPGREQTMSRNPQLHQALAPAFGSIRPYDLQLFDDEGQAVRWLLAS
jgi:hypothetical protein